MGKFAKLFDVDDEQVLVTIQENSAGFPEVRFRTEINGVNFEMAPSWEPKNKSEKFDMDNAWKVAEGYFNSIKKKQCKVFRTGFLSVTGSADNENI